MDVQVKLKDSKLKATQVGAGQVDAIIKGFFNALSDSPSEKQVKVDVQLNGEKLASTITKKRDENEVVKAVVAPQPVTPPSQNLQKVLPKINDQRSLKVPISEIVETKEEEEHWKTGIKMKEGVPTYRAKYWCDCGTSGKRYIPKDVPYLYCHDCNGKLAVEPATLEVDENGLPKRDEWGNFYIAREDYVEETH